MVSPAFALDPTGYMPIETLADARTVITQCINGPLKLVPRGPTDQEAAQFIGQNAVFVFEVLDQVSNLPAWPEPGFYIKNIPSDTGVGARRKSITTMVKGRQYCVVAICSSQNLMNPDLQPRHDNRHGRPDSQSLQPSELILPKIHTPTQTPVADWDAFLSRIRRDRKDNKGSEME
ncbi:hypothetical protein ACHAPQ_001937 [Fusarium lateritium]